MITRYEAPRLQIAPGDFGDMELGAGERGAYVLFADHEREVAALKAECAQFKRKLAVLFDEVNLRDSLGVPGSDFATCRWCGGGSYPGNGYKHNNGITYLTP